MHMISIFFYNLLINNIELNYWIIKNFLHVHLRYSLDAFEVNKYLICLFQKKKMNKHCIWYFDTRSRSYKKHILKKIILGPESISLRYNLLFFSIMDYIEIHSLKPIVIMLSSSFSIFFFFCISWYDFFLSTLLN